MDICNFLLVIYELHKLLFFYFNQIYLVCETNVHKICKYICKKRQKYKIEKTKNPIRLHHYFPHYEWIGMTNDENVAPAVCGSSLFLILTMYIHHT